MKHDVHIAHISDLHIAGSGEGRQLQDLDRMLEYLNVSGYDHLVISGDLSDRGRTEDWAIVKDKLVRHGWYHWERTTVVAGNHDLIRLEEEMRFYNAMNLCRVFGRGRAASGRNHSAGFSVSWLLAGMILNRLFPSSR